jgi:hypothetical protein
MKLWSAVVSIVDATFYTTGMEPLAHERDWHRVGADAVAGGAASRVRRST